jgi:hypothetical protein
MTRYFRERLAAGGLFIVPQRRAIAEVIESLLLVWTASRAEEWRDAIVYLTLPYLTFRSVESFCPYGPRYHAVIERSILY